MNRFRFDDLELKNCQQAKPEEIKKQFSKSYQTTEYCEYLNTEEINEDLSEDLQYFDQEYAFNARTKQSIIDKTNIDNQQQLTKKIQLSQNQISTVTFQQKESSNLRFNLIQDKNQVSEQGEQQKNQELKQCKYLYTSQNQELENKIKQMEQNMQIELDPMIQVQSIRRKQLKNNPIFNSCDSKSLNRDLKSGPKSNQKSEWSYQKQNDLKIENLKFPKNQCCIEDIVDQMVCLFGLFENIHFQTIMTALNLLKKFQATECFQQQLKQIPNLIEISGFACICISSKYWDVQQIQFQHFQYLQTNMVDIKKEDVVKVPLCITDKYLPLAIAQYSSQEYKQKLQQKIEYIMKKNLDKIAGVRDYLQQQFDKLQIITDLKQEFKLQSQTNFESIIQTHRYVNLIQSLFVAATTAVHQYDES
ncbi:UNKNOWN [Stylonychia lemnae]|uniref:Uncharacterized protein n=1 Tax=Stylonychia lemnae TaxID=5949 RepID=A0A078B6S1_STYLE|nr:UNKNOWN [Stylonychia lemnae]|eukprot:CDW89881.1 UNKNOWN [Stylonychia lemnae]